MAFNFKLLSRVVIASSVRPGLELIILKRSFKTYPLFLKRSRPGSQVTRLKASSSRAHRWPYNRYLDCLKRRTLLGMALPNFLLLREERGAPAGSSALWLGENHLFLGGFKVDWMLGRFHFIMPRNVFKVRN